MSIQVFVKPLELCAGSLELRGEEHHYLAKVRRAQVGDEVVVLDGESKRARARVVAIDKKTTTLSIDAPEHVPVPVFSLQIIPALIKGDRMDWAIVKLAELGVDRISPTVSEHGVVRFSGQDASQKACKRRERFQSLVRSAARQSNNPQPPRVDAITDLSAVFKACTAELRLIPYAGDHAAPLASELPDDAPASVAVAIGPEGGFSQREIVDAKAAGFTPVQLGPRILRAETAAIACAAIVRFRYGDLGSE